MPGELKIIKWPDPRLKKTSVAVKEFTPALRALAERMLELMREAHGVGLAAPQVGQNIRMFVMNPTGQPDDDRIYINPVLSDPEGDEASEEGCLSLPGINAQIDRNRTIRMQAQDLEGNRIEELQTGFVARVWQHEYDHLNGVMIIDRMGLGDRLKYRKVLREMEDDYAVAHPAPPPPKSKVVARTKPKGSRSK